MITLHCRGRVVERNRALVMAIVNRTPDSFYDRGSTYDLDAALRAVDAAVADGADIVDIGGVKAGPGSEVSVAEEIRRVVPLVAAVRERHPDLLISVDTWRSEVGRSACEVGADILNDTWQSADPALAEVAAEFEAGYVCSHTGGAPPRTLPHRVSYPDVVAAVIEEVTGRAERLAAMGVPRGGILIDPTHDFGKNTWHGLELLRRIRELTTTPWPVLLALSNKDFVGETLGAELHDRVDGTLAATAVAAWEGAAVFRAHEVRRTRQVVDMVASIRGTRPPTLCLRGLT
ncbi:dihydropteroate synthase [Saccharomonospora viridis]|uniref:Dihydropteroate synthase n=2 Tax=Saccharomonospora viridis TaxID=1852 RepID=C7MZT8_SACVD|nr:Dihydropteroate synthase [Saccharomonospora viridis DSM 43017]KHF45288.1 dihydropteroate synthase [Saccharomonospora viridis]SFP80029.1 dihydropteroate synthase [Saccharomonospora viridis]